MSLQAWIVKKIIKKVAPREKDFSLRRKSTDELCRKYSLAKNIKFQQVQLGSVTAEWAFLESSPIDKAIVFLQCYCK